MKVKRSEAVAALKALGLLAAGNWDAKKLKAQLERLDQLKGVEDLLKKVKDKKLKNLLDALLTACEEEKSVFVEDDGRAAAPAALKNGKAKADADEGDDDDEDDEDDDEEESEGPEEEEGDEEDDEEEEEEKPAKKSKPKKGGKAKAGKNGKPKKKPAEKKSSVRRDEFGTSVEGRTGRNHRINMVILKAKGKMLTAPEISKRADADGTPHEHLKRLIRLGFVKEKLIDGRKHFGLNPKAKLVKS
jgi:outer membrane biosynthesis protein TonB